MKAKHDMGFTLVEVMVALAVVAVVSLPLLQMFVTTSYANKDAQVMDRLNVIAVQKGETFKANPQIVYNPDHPDYYYFYKEDLTPILPDQDFNDLTIIPEGAAFMIQSHLPDPDTQSNAEGYYPKFVGTIDLSHLVGPLDLLHPIDLTVNITNNYGIDVEPAESPFVSDSSKITNMVIPIKVNYREDLRSINVTNDSNKEAEFYVFNTNDDSELSINTVQGASSKTYVRTTGTGSNMKYDLTLTANRLSQGAWVEMFTYFASANKQI